MRDGHLREGLQSINHYNNVHCTGVFATQEGFFGLELNFKMKSKMNMLSNRKFMFG